jgi:hypothetical protein
VLLSNNKIGQVVDVNPENPRYPVVQLLGEAKSDGKPKLVETASTRHDRAPPHQGRGAVLVKS